MSTHALYGISLFLTFCFSCRFSFPFVIDFLDLRLCPQNLYCLTRLCDSSDLSNEHGHILSHWHTHSVLGFVLPFCSFFISLFSSSRFHICSLVIAASIIFNLAAAYALALALLWLGLWFPWVLLLVQRGVGGLDEALHCMNCIACVHVAYHTVCLYVELLSFLLE
jgi:hypothetical protein